MTTRKLEAKGQLYKAILAFILGFCMVYTGWEATIYFWLDESKASFSICLKVFICFLGLLLMVFSIYELMFIIQLRFQKQRPIVEAITWKHFQMIETSEEDFKLNPPDEVAFERPKIQALTRNTKDLIKTNQVVPVLSEDDVALIKNISINFSIKK